MFDWYPGKFLLGGEVEKQVTGVNLPLMVRASILYNDNQLNKALVLLTLLSSASDDYIKKTIRPDLEETLLIWQLFGFGSLEDARSAVMKNKVELDDRIRTLKNILAVPRAQSLDEFFSTATGELINEFLTVKPQYRSTVVALEQTGKMEASKRGGKPKVIRPPAVK